MPEYKIILSLLLWLTVCCLDFFLSHLCKYGAIFNIMSNCRAVLTRRWPMLVNF